MFYFTVVCPYTGGSSLLGLQLRTLHLPKCSNIILLANTSEVFVFGDKPSVAWEVLVSEVPAFVVFSFVVLSVQIIITIVLAKFALITTIRKLNRTVICGVFKAAKLTLSRWRADRCTSLRWFRRHHSEWAIPLFVIPADSISFHWPLKHDFSQLSLK